METISRSLLTFFAQFPLADSAGRRGAALVCRSMRRGPASHRHAVWVAALIAAVLLPLASVRSGQPTATLQFDASLAGVAANSQPHLTAQAARALPPPVSRTVSFAETTATLLLELTSCSSSIASAAWRGHPSARFRSATERKTRQFRKPSTGCGCAARRRSA